MMYRKFQGSRMLAFEQQRDEFREKVKESIFLSFPSPSSILPDEHRMVLRTLKCIRIVH